MILQNAHQPVYLCLQWPVSLSPLHPILCHSWLHDQGNTSVFVVGPCCWELTTCCHTDNKGTWRYLLSHTCMKWSLVAQFMLPGIFRTNYFPHILFTIYIMLHGFVIYLCTNLLPGIQRKTLLSPRQKLVLLSWKQLNLLVKTDYYGNIVIINQLWSTRSNLIKVRTVQNVRLLLLLLFSVPCDTCAQCTLPETQTRTADQTCETTQVISVTQRWVF